jgi:hypothetical protein
MAAGKPQTCSTAVRCIRLIARGEVAGGQKFRRIASILPFRRLHGRAAVFALKAT